MLEKILAALCFISITFTANATTIDNVFDALKTKDYSLTFKLAKPLADQGNLDAEWLVANFLLHGTGVKQNIGKSISYFRKCAENTGLSDMNSADKEKGECSFIVYQALINGTVLKKDVALAGKYLRKSACLGNQEAIEQILSLYCPDNNASCTDQINEQLSNCKDSQ